MTQVMQKHRAVTLERIEKFMHEVYWKESNIRSWLYIQRVKINEIAVFSPPFEDTVAKEKRVEMGVDSHYGLNVPFKDIVNQNFRLVKEGETFGPSWTTHWFRFTVSIPSEWKGKEVHLLWDTNCEGFLHDANGIPLQAFTGGNGCDRRAEFILSKSADPEKWGSAVFYVEMAANHMFGNDDGGIGVPLETRRFGIRQCEVALFCRMAWDTLYDLEVLYGLAKHLPEEDPRGAQALFVANAVVNSLWTTTEGEEPDWVEARRIAAGYLSQRNGDGQAVVSCTGITHIDTAWLWSYRETRRKTARSWVTQMRYMDEGDYPFYHFTCSQAQQLAWLKTDYPAIFAETQRKSKEGKFVVTGGTWVEMDCNIPNGESFVRQFLYGQQFFLEEFGKQCDEFWLPDTFGYSSQLPQIVREAEMSWFMSQKLSWNLINKFPHSSFWWEGLDGSRVLTHFPPADTYNAQALPEEVLKSARSNKDRERTNESLMVLGYGDGGGGPQRQMLERIKRMSDINGCPRVEMRSPSEFFRRLEKDGDKLLTWSGELYFELHRGTYTTHAFVKAGNRRCEVDLRNCEMLSVAEVVQGRKAPNDGSVDHADVWKRLLLTQFHDVLPGTSIGRVYKDVAVDFDIIDEHVQKSLSSSIESLVGHVEHRPVAFNSLSWPRRGYVGTKNRVLVEAEGLSFAWPSPSAERYERVSVTQADHEVVLENKFLRCVLSKGGALLSLFCKTLGRESIAGGKEGGIPFGNFLAIYDDMPFFWDAWDVMVYHVEKMKPLGEASHCEVTIETDTLISITFQYAYNKSTITQRVSLSPVSRRLEFDTTVEWHERHKFLKVLFPFDVRSEYASYHTQYGFIRRPTHRNDSWAMAKFEVCGHYFGDLSEHGFGVSLLNDSKYGYSTMGNVMALSLLRAPKKPDDTADMGHHEFRYAVFPHVDSFPCTAVIEEAYDFNHPLIPCGAIPDSGLPGPPPGDYGDGVISPLGFSLSATHVMVDAVKIPESILRREGAGGSEQRAMIVRLFEWAGGLERVHIKCSKAAIASCSLVNILEHPKESGDEDAVITEDTEEFFVYSLTVRPFKIVSLLVRLAPSR